VSLAFFAAFWEESVFRAVPIACAALLGARFGRRGLWIWSAVVVQALVFAAGHANYPQQPPYARVVELSAPALLWGVVYLRYGLVPTILAHFLYDLSLISIVLFESNAVLDQGVVTAVGLLPLGVVVAARWRRGSRERAPDRAMNAAWEPKAAAVPVEPVRDAGPSEGADDDGTRRPARLPTWSVRLALGVGAVLLLATLSTRPPPPRLWGDRGGAVEAADGALAADGVDVERWSRGVTTSSGNTAGSSYVFQEAGYDAWAGLVGRYFGEPRWIVRYVDWEAEAEARVEEYRVWVGREGRVTRVSHTLPEGRPGASLSVEAARALALEAADDRFGATAAELEEVEAAETRRPTRTDWLFTFTEVGLLPDVSGEARLQVRVTGDEVADVAPTVHIPEEWERDRRRVESRSGIMQGGLRLLLLLGYGAAAVAAVVAWSRRRLPTAAVWKVIAVGVATLTVSLANDWPSTAAAFSTAQPWGFQVGATALAFVLLVAVAAPAIGLVAALGHGWLSRVGVARPPRYAGSAFGLLAGALALVVPVVPPRPTFADYFPAAALLPELGAAGVLLVAQLLLTSAVLVAVGLHLRFRDRAFVGTTLWSLAVAVAVVAVPLELQTSVATWAVGALLIAAALVAGLMACTLHPEAVPAFVGTALAVQALWTSVSAPYAGARVGGLVAVALIGALAWWWTQELRRSTGRS
jgi:hypothetical protein